MSRAHLSPYAERVPFTPHIQRFADEGIVFTRHNTEAGQSAPAYASILTGTQADRHRIYSNPTRLADSAYLIAEAFRDNGYETHFWSAHAMASVANNFGQGVPAAHTSSPGEELASFEGRLESLLHRQRQDGGLRAFVQVAFTLTHSPYSAVATPQRRARFCARFPDQCAAVDEALFERYVPLYEEHRLQLAWNFDETRSRLRLAEADVAELAKVLEVLYRVSVHELDRYFGAFVEGIRREGLLEESLIALTADHGEILYRSNALYKWSHGYQLAPEVLTVPWIVRRPEAAGAGSRFPGVTRSTDVFPTLAGIAGIQLPPGQEPEGRDLTSALASVEPPPDLEALSHTTVIHPVHLERSKNLTLWYELTPRTDPRLMWVRSRRGDLVRKLRLFPDGRWGAEVFDLAADPQETSNLLDPEDQEQAAGLQRLAAYKERLVKAYGGVDTPSESSGEVEDRLRSLGYIE